MVSAQFTVAAQRSVAGDQPRNRIPPDRGSNRAHSLSIADAARDLGIGGDVARWHREQCLPDLDLERGADQVESYLPLTRTVAGPERRRDQVRALGFEPQVVDRTRRATVYWVDVTLGPEQRLDFDALQPQGRIIRLEQRSCESPKG